MMSFGDFYDVVVLFALLGLPFIAVAWCVDRWPEWKQRHEEFAAGAGYRWWLVKQDAMWRLGGTVFRPWIDPSPTRRPR